MGSHNCETCKFREIYDNKPKSLLGRIWRWHASWCPGWKKYMSSLPGEERMMLAEKYDFKNI